MTSVFLLAFVLVCFTEYLRRLSLRLQTRHPLAKPQPTLSPAELDRLSDYKDINLLQSIPSSPTNNGYIVIGGSGFLGRLVSMRRPAPVVEWRPSLLLLLAFTKLLPPTIYRLATSSDSYFSEANQTSE